jgi:hypothetical protein
MSEYDDIDEIVARIERTTEELFRRLDAVETAHDPVERLNAWALAALEVIGDLAPEEAFQVMIRAVMRYHDYSLLVLRAGRGITDFEERLDTLTEEDHRAFEEHRQAVVNLRFGELTADLDE